MKHSLVINALTVRLENLLNEIPSTYIRKHLVEVKKMGSAVEGLERLALSRNLKDTNEAHVAKVAAATKRLGSESNNMLNRVSDIYREGYEALTNSIKNQADLVPNKFAVEVRQAFNGLTFQQKMDALNDTLKKKDSQTLAAILEAPRVVTGLDEATVERYKNSAEKALAPELYKEREKLEDSLQIALAAEKSVRSAIKDGFDPEKLAEIEEAETRHKEASLAFESAVSA